MSSIIEALKKAEKEEKIKKEKGAERIVWIPSERKSMSPLFSKILFILSSSALILFLAIGFKWAWNQAPEPKQAKPVVLPKTDLHLSGVLWDPYDPIALINSRTARKGNFINGAQVVAIHRNYVEMLTDGNRWVLALEN